MSPASPATVRPNKGLDKPNVNAFPKMETADEGYRGQARADAILELIGAPSDDPEMRGLPDAVRKETSRYWDLFIEPLISEHWPRVRQTPFYAKFKIGTQKVYAPAPYTVVVLSKRRPVAIRAMNAICRFFRVSRSAVIAGLSVMLPLYTRLFMRRENKRIVMMAAFIAVVDEAFDDHLEHVPPKERGAALRGILSGQITPPSPPFALVRALRVALDEGTTDEESDELARAMEGCVAWGEAEVKRFLKEPDPQGLAHRGVGITTGIDGLAWTVRRYITQSEWHWMYDVSNFIQMLDDWIDLEKDLAEGVVTPVAEGRWTLETIREEYARTTARISEIAHENGETYGPYLQLASDSYAYQVRDLLQNMVNGIAD